MPIDPYAPCPGGTGKKIKFCCADLVPELEKIQRMLEGEQRAACLEHIESIEGKYPERACLLSIKSMLQAQLGQDDKAQQTLATFVAKYPDNPVALAEQATMKVAESGGVAAIPRLQDALEKCNEQIPAQVYDAIGLVAQGLISENELFAARAHLVLQLGMSGTRDQQPLQLLMRLNASTSVPVLAKQELPLVPPPDDAIWKNGFNEALSPAMRGAWRKAAEDLLTLAAKVGDWPAIWRNIAILRTWLADPRAIGAWRKYGSQAIPLEDAVEAEAMAQSLDDESIDMIDVLSIEYAIENIEVLQARLTANPRALQMPIDLSRMGNEESPPPKGAFWLLNREVPASGKDLTPADVPHVAGQVFIYGKQTDREARLELAAYRPDLEEAQKALNDIAGDSLGPQRKLEISTEVPALQHALTTNWRLPEDTPAEKRLELIQQQRRDILLNKWPNMPRKIFGGKSATAIAADKAMQTKLLAAILLLELATDQVASEFNFNELRTKLGMPEQEPIDPTGAELSDLPLARMGRVDVKKLTDEQLVDLYQRADHYRHIAALRHLAQEVIAREGLDDKVDKAEVYGLLAQIEPDGNQAVTYLDKAREAAEATKKSTAPWDLAELALRIARGEAADADRLLHHIRDHHIREPGVAQALYQILAEAGIIGPDGQPAMAGGAAPVGGAEIMAPGAASEPGKLWTPDGGEPSGGAKKSTIWTPD